MFFTHVCTSEQSNNSTRTNIHGVLGSSRRWHVPQKFPGTLSISLAFLCFSRCSCRGVLWLCGVAWRFVSVLGHQWPSNGEQKPSVSCALKNHGQYMTVPSPRGLPSPAIDCSPIHWPPGWSLLTIEPRLEHTTLRSWKDSESEFGLRLVRCVFRLANLNVFLQTMGNHHEFG